MTDCTCSDEQAKSTDEEIVETEEVELAAGLEEPVEVGKEEALMKDMEATLAKLKEVLAYLEDMGEEKAEEDEEVSPRLGERGDALLVLGAQDEAQGHEDAEGIASVRVREEGLGAVVGPHHQQRQNQ